MISGRVEKKNTSSKGRKKSGTNLLSKTSGKKSRKLVGGLELRNLGIS